MLRALSLALLVTSVFVRGGVRAARRAATGGACGRADTRAASGLTARRRPP